MYTSCMLQYEAVTSPAIVTQVFVTPAQSFETVILREILHASDQTFTTRVFLQRIQLQIHVYILAQSVFYIISKVEQVLLVWYTRYAS